MIWNVSFISYFFGCCSILEFQFSCGLIDPASHNEFRTKPLWETREQYWRKFLESLETSGGYSLTQLVLFFWKFGQLKGNLDCYCCFEPPLMSTLMSKIPLQVGKCQVLNAMTYSCYFSAKKTIKGKFVSLKYNTFNTPDIVAHSANESTPSSKYGCVSLKTNFT